jgi:hypothetical protein
MIANRMKRTLSLAVVTAMIVMLAGVSGAHAATAPIKEVVASHFGREVNLTKVQEHAGPGLEDICTVGSGGSGDTCQMGKESSISGGFAYPLGVAGAPNGNVYVTDSNSRVQEFKATGEFLSTFGKEGTAAGEFRVAGSVAVDSNTPQNLYVQDVTDWRVEEFTADGEFVSMFGKDVNETKEKEGAPQAQRNICSEEEIKNSGVKCKTGVRSSEGSTEPGAFHFAYYFGDLLAVGPKDVLYVGDEHRVQEFEANGKYKTEIPLTSNAWVSALAVDGAGDTYLVLSQAGGLSTNVIHEFTPTGDEVKNEVFPLTLSAKEPNTESIEIGGIALDSSGRLAVTEREGVNLRGTLYEVATGHVSTRFASPGGGGIAFNGSDELYAVANPSVVNRTGHEVWSYTPLPVAELAATAATCEPGAEHETDATLDCNLNGEVDPWGVPETEVWFEWGRTAALGSETPRREVPTGSTPVSVHANVEGVRPNESSFYYQLAANDHNVKSPETLTSPGVVSFTTPIVAPRIVGEPSAPFAHASRAVMFAELNPENAKTEYFFEYGSPGALASCPKGVRGAEACPGVAATPAMESATYGEIGTTVEVTGLQPATPYGYRLFAESENTGKTTKRESIGSTGSFTTALAPAPQATTGQYSGVSATSAIVSGTVDPDGAPATYSFELGVYNGGATQYGVVFSGPAGASTAPVEESLALTGLQPGTTYAYRIVVKSGYGTAFGATVTFTTAGLPEVLVVPTVLGQLPVPNIAFPKEPAKVTPKKLTRAQQLARALKACAKKPKSKRAACKRSARKKYAVTKTKGKKK